MTDAELTLLKKAQAEAAADAVPQGPSLDVAALNFKAGVYHGLRRAEEILVKKEDDE